MGGTTTWAILKTTGFMVPPHVGFDGGPAKSRVEDHTGMAPLSSLRRWRRHQLAQLRCVKEYPNLADLAAFGREELGRANHCRGSRRVAVVEHRAAVLSKAGFQQRHLAHHAAKVLQRSHQLIGRVERVDAAFEVDVVGEARTRCGKVAGCPLLLIPLYQFSI